MDLKNIKFDKSKINPKDIEEINALVLDLTSNTSFMKKLKKFQKKELKKIQQQ